MMKKLNLILVFLIVISCKTIADKKDHNPLKLISKLSKKLTEVSGVQTLANSDLLWMHNDSGNTPKIYGVSKAGAIEKVITIVAKNNDWEDIAVDKQGNLYLADVGNNANKRKNLRILKIRHSDLMKDQPIKPEQISFYYPEQTKFPPEKQARFFDAEALLFFKGNCYIFTKSRVKNAHGKTSLYKIPARAGNYKAKFIAQFNTGKSLFCSVTGADISSDGKKVALLTYDAVWVFTDFKGDNFFSGQAKKMSLQNYSQTEGICFKDKDTLYITDERTHGTGGNLYELKLE